MLWDVIREARSGLHRAGVRQARLDRAQQDAQDAGRRSWLDHPEHLEQLIEGIRATGNHISFHNLRPDHKEAIQKLEQAMTKHTCTRLVSLSTLLPEK